MVNQLQAERDALAARVQKPVNWKLAESVRPVHGSTEAADLVFDRASKRRACVEEIPSTEQNIVRVVVFQTARVEGRSGDGRDEYRQGFGAFDRQWFGEVRQHASVHGDPHGYMKAAQVVHHQCGWLGCRIGEASLTPRTSPNSQCQEVGEVYPGLTVRECRAACPTVVAQTWSWKLHLQTEIQ